MMQLRPAKAYIPLPFLHATEATRAHPVQFWQRAVTVAMLAAGLDALLWLYLYGRPTPFGRPFALDPSHYVFHAIYYGTWAHALLLLPFLGMAVLAQRCQSRRLSRASFGVQLAVTTALLIIGTVDRECQRFMGMHATLSWLKTYGAVHRTPDAIVDAFARDAGGSYAAFYPLLPILLFPLIARALSKRVAHRWLTKPRLLCVVVVFLLLPTASWTVIPGGHLRQSKVRPALLLAWREVMPKKARETSAGELEQRARTYRAHQAKLDPSGRWRLDDPEYPLRKHFVGELPKLAERPNIIVLQLETFRAKDMKSMNPGLRGKAPTPFLDQLARAPDSGFFVRHTASGVPTVHAFMAIHAGLLMHPSKSIPSESTHVNIEGFPSALRRNGYQTLHFTGSDPDWDSQRVWLDRWYDEVHYDPGHDEQDRAVFRAAGERLHDVGKSGEPFLAYLASISNHHPFRLPEQSLAINDGATVVDGLHNTMHYTDDVVREFYESLSNEPWFARTIWIITGDHGFDLADRGEAGGHENLRHETTWVPLIVHGRDPRLPRGQIDSVSGHIDLAPTIAELANVWDDNSYMGHSLLRADESAETLVLRQGNYAFETGAHSLFKAAGEKPWVYEGHDRIQARALVNPPPELLTRAHELAEAYEAMVSYAVDHDRVLPNVPKALASWARPAQTSSALR